MFHYISTLIEILVVLLFVMLPFAIYAITKKRNDLADVFWGISFIVIAWTGYFAQSYPPRLAFIVNILVTIWGVRLALHIFKRFKNSTEEDRRYHDMRKNWKINQDLASFYYIFCFQAVLAIIVALPVTIINTATAVNNSAIVIVGVILWLFGFGYESLADKQLKDFITNPKNRGKLMTKGLFRHSRHPNYFGELVQWWSIAFIALFVNNGFYGTIGALTITALITMVSGVPLAEKGTANKPGWDAYKKKTPSLIPRLKLSK